MSDEGGVAAVDRALSILDALTDDKVTLAELAKRTGLYKSTVLRLLKSLERFGYVFRSADGSYRLGSKVLTLGALYQRHYRTSEIVPPVLERLVAELHDRYQVGCSRNFYLATRGFDLEVQKGENVFMLRCDVAESSPASRLSERKSDRHSS